VLIIDTGCSSMGEIYDAVVMDKTPRVIMQGGLHLHSGFPYAVVEVYSESKEHPGGLRGEWEVGVAYLDYTDRQAAGFDPNDPRVLVAGDQHFSGVNNVPVEVVQWDNGPKLRYGYGNLSHLGVVKFRWAEPGPSIFSDPPKKPEAQEPSGN
jgi:hypothetical protein